MIFTTTEQIKEAYSAPNINNEFDSIASYLEDALPYVLPYLSQAQWDKLVTDFENNETDENHLALLKATRKALIHFAYWLYSDGDGDMQISDKGFTRFESSDEKTPYATQMRRFRKARLRDGWNAIEAMLMLLNSKKDVFTDWAGSDEYDTIKSFFIWNTVQYRKHRQIKNLGVLDKLRGAAIHVQDEIIKPNVGDDFYDELITEVAADNISADNVKVVNYIRKAIAHLIIERGIDEGIIEFGEDGATLNSFEEYTGGGDKGEAPNEKRIANIKDEAGKKGQAAIADLKDYLNANASDTKYNTYYLSDLYDDPNDTDEPRKFNNTEGGTFFAV